MFYYISVVKTINVQIMYLQRKFYNKLTKGKYLLKIVVDGHFKYIVKNIMNTLRKEIK